MTPPQRTTRTSASTVFDSVKIMLATESAWCYDLPTSWPGSITSSVAPRFADERLDLLAVTTETAFDIAGRTVAECQPDDLRRSTEQGGTTAEVLVLRHYGEAMLLRVAPNGRVVRRRQSNRSNVNNIAPDVAKAVAEPRGEILVEEQLHRPPTGTRRRSRSAANARQARMSSVVRSGKSRSTSSSDIPEAK